MDKLALLDIIKQQNREREFLADKLKKKSEEYRILTGTYFVTRYLEE